MRSYVVLAAIAVFAACSKGSNPLEPEAVDFTAKSEIVEDGARVLRVTLSAKNVTSEPVTLEWGECAGEPARVRAYARNSAEPAWDALDGESLCSAVGLHRTLAAGESASFVLRIPVSAILGNQVISGEYEITVTPNFVNLGDRSEIRTGTLQLVTS
jgi:hypothetical protein